VAPAGSVTVADEESTVVAGSASASMYAIAKSLLLYGAPP
jgi:hypothetical protein